MPFLHAWHADLAADYSAADLAPAERERLTRLRTPTLRQTYGRAHVFLRAVLSHYTGVSASDLLISPDSNGKPTLTHFALHFNLSYRPGCALLAVSDAGPVGADVEPLQPLPDAAALVQQLFSAPEQAALHAVEPGGWWALFYTIWTRKEAYAKALGMGLGMEFAEFSVVDGLGPAGYQVHSFVLTITSPPSPLSKKEGELALVLDSKTSSPSFLERGLGGEVIVAPPGITLAAIATPSLLPLRHFCYPADL
ncbi:MAG: 4'-phosphopantetheinyl transferase family protein [Janthinobacterium lividum]